ncbi:MAG: DUF2505 family protein [Myxococcota bacterium]
MHFDLNHVTRHPRDLVFATHRDHIEALAAYLPDVERIEVRGRSRHADGREVQTQWWVGSTSALPLLLRPMVPAHLLQWQQTTTWDPAAWTASWEIEVPGLGAAVSARGKHTYERDPAGCRIALEGDFAFRPDRVPQLAQVPAAAIPVVERAVVSIVLPMIERTGEAVGRYLDDR